MQLLIAQRLRRQGRVYAAPVCGSDKATILSVYPVVIEPPKPTFDSGKAVGTGGGPAPEGT